ncbi:MAG: helix-turn-helix transcriptional regulator [Candidatus Riflebacteria bacterium]|nr:helix-turn-helix transcriptional regulator [Candidatus Riflebacteria bacterium]
MELYIQLAEAFIESPGAVLSILQISKKLDIPYGTAYNRIHQLAEMGVVRIVPHGKAKLCVINPSNPMASSILALGAARKTSKFFTVQKELSSRFSKLKDVFESRLIDHVHSAILLNPESLQISEPTKEILLDESYQALDFFLILPQDKNNPPYLESELISAGASSIQIVTPTTLLGMLSEKENDAGLLAYQMLRKGLLITGFERFFSLVMKAFPSPNL